MLQNFSFGGIAPLCHLRGYEPVAKGSVDLTNFPKNLSFSRQVTSTASLKFYQRWLLGGHGGQRHVSMSK